MRQITTKQVLDISYTGIRKSNLTEFIISVNNFMSLQISFEQKYLIWNSKDLKQFWTCELNVQFFFGEINRVEKQLMLFWLLFSGRYVQYKQ